MFNPESKVLTFFVGMMFASTDEFRKAMARGVEIQMEKSGKTIIGAAAPLAIVLGAFLQVPIYELEILW